MDASDVLSIGRRNVGVGDNAPIYTLLDPIAALDLLLCDNPLILDMVGLLHRTRDQDASPLTHHIAQEVGSHDQRGPGRGITWMLNADPLGDGLGYSAVEGELLADIEHRGGPVEDVEEVAFYIGQQMMDVAGLQAIRPVRASTRRYVLDREPRLVIRAGPGAASLRMEAGDPALVEAVLAAPMPSPRKRTTPFDSTQIPSERKLG